MTHVRPGVLPADATVLLADLFDHLVDIRTTRQPLRREGAANQDLLRVNRHPLVIELEGDPSLFTPLSNLGGTRRTVARAAAIDLPGHGECSGPVGSLGDDGLFFQHVFAHKSRPYAFEVKDESDWMSRYFFTGGMMPSHDMLDHLDIPFELVDRWKVSGTHYARTSEH